MASVVGGVAAGLVATIAMTAAMAALGGGGQPATARLLAHVAGGSPADHAAAGMALHLCYGTVTGVVVAVGAPAIGLALDGAIAVGLGLACGIALMISGTPFWMRPVVGLEPDREMLVAFGAIRLTDGLVSGACLGAGLVA